MYNVSRYVTCVKYSTVDEIWSITEEAVTHQASVMHEFQVLVILGWLVAMALGSWALLSPWHLARRDYVYDAEEATSYNVISPVLSALALCWLIFACYTNHGGLASFFFFFFFELRHILLSFNVIFIRRYIKQIPLELLATGLQQDIVCHISHAIRSIFLQRWDHQIL